MRKLIKAHQPLQISLWYACLWVGRDELLQRSRETSSQGTNNNYLKECLYTIKYCNNIFGLCSDFGYLLTLQSTKCRERIKSHR